MKISQFNEFHIRNITDIDLKIDVFFYVFAFLLNII